MKFNHFKKFTPIHQKIENGKIVNTRKLEIQLLLKMMTDRALWNLKSLTKLNIIFKHP